MDPTQVDARYQIQFLSPGGGVLFDNNPSTGPYSGPILYFVVGEGISVDGALNVHLALASLLQQGVIGTGGFQQIQGPLFLVGNPGAGTVPPFIGLNYGAVLQDGPLVFYDSSEGAIALANADLTYNPLGVGGGSLTMEAAGSVAVDAQSATGLAVLSSSGSGQSVSIDGTTGLMNLSANSEIDLVAAGSMAIGRVLPSAEGYDAIFDISTGLAVTAAFSVQGVPGASGTLLDGSALDGGIITSIGASGPTLAGDVTGPATSNTVSDLQTFPLALAAPAVNDVLTWDGANVVFAPGGGGGGGGLTLIATQSAASSASIDLLSVFSNAYDDYLVELVDIVPATTGAGTILLIQFSADGGATWDTNAADYYSHGFSFWASFGVDVTTTQPGLAINYNMDSVTLYPVSAYFRLQGMQNTTAYKRMLGESECYNTFVAGPLGSVIRGVFKVTAAQDSLRIIAGSGVITSGTVRVYGFQPV